MDSVDVLFVRLTSALQEMTFCSSVTNGKLPRNVARFEVLPSGNTYNIHNPLDVGFQSATFSTSYRAAELNDSAGLEQRQQQKKQQTYFSLDHSDYCI